MTEIRFYHLQTQSPDQALPLILSKSLERGQRVGVKLPDEKEAERLCDLLWTARPDSFLPHGTKKDGNGPDQPVWLTAEDDNPGLADTLVLIGGASSDKVADYFLCCEFFDGRDDAALRAAREKWKAYKDSGHEVTYWQQTEKGGWDKK